MHLTRQSIFRYLIIFFLLSLLLIFLQQNANYADSRLIEIQQVTPFLVTPYYGEHFITSYFDHKYPTYGAPPNDSYPNVVRYDGEDLPDCSTNSPPCLYYDGHNGIDFNLEYEPVLAAGTGTVMSAGWEVPNCHDPIQNPIQNCLLGLHITIDHGNGYITRYGHLSAIAVGTGQTVLQGQIIGASGNTGNSYGAHLHFDVYRNGLSVDPFGWSGGYNDPWRDYAGAVSEWLWADGQWAGNPVRKPPAEPAITIDNNDPAFSKGCSPYPRGSCPYWYYASGVGVNGDMWWTYVTDQRDDYWALWQPDFTVPRFYEVEVFVPNNHATSWQAGFLVHSPADVQRTVVDQQGTSDYWLSLGHHFLREGNNPWGAV